MTDFRRASPKVCQTCGEDFTPKRSDAKYCSIKCKNALNNYRNREAEAAHEAIVGETNAMLWRNREVLLKYAGKEVELTTLKAVGFDSRFLTNFELIDPNDSQKGNRIFIYDISYEYVDAQTIKISNHE